MKAFKLSSLFIASLFVSAIAFSQSKKETIPVNGNCGMCEKKIETAAKDAGATSAEWDATSKVLTVEYSSSTTNAAKIQQAIAKVGYDTRDFKASDESYDKLHSCCKYDRKDMNVSEEKNAKSCCGNCEIKDGKCVKGDNCEMKDGKCTGKCSADKAHSGKDAACKMDGKMASADGKSCCAAH